MNKLDEFRKKLCGIHSPYQESTDSNVTDNLKTVIGLDSSNKALNLIQMYEDLNADDCPIDLIESISKLIAELSKDGIFFCC